MLRHARFLLRASRSGASEKCSAGKNRLCQFLAAELESSAFDALESAPSSESTLETHIEHVAARRAAGLRDGDGGSPDPQASFGLCQRLITAAAAPPSSLGLCPSTTKELERMGSAELYRAGCTPPTSASLSPPSAPHPSPNFSETLQGGHTERRGVAAVLKVARRAAG